MPQKPDSSDTMPSIGCGVILGATATLVWFGSWIAWAKFPTHVAPSVLVVGACGGLNMLAARWVISGPGKWWLRVMQAFAAVTGLVSLGYQLARLINPAQASMIAPGVVTIHLAMDFLVSLLVVAVETVMLERCYRIGPVASATNADPFRLSLFEIFQIVAIVAILLAAALPYDFSITLRGQNLYDFFDRATLLAGGVGMPLALVLLLASIHVELSAVDDTRSVLGLVAVVWCWIVMFAEPIGGLCALPAAAYTIVYGSLSACRAFGWFALVTSDG